VVFTGSTFGTMHDDDSDAIFAERMREPVAFASN
jgi:hypothetical protein